MESDCEAGLDDVRRKIEAMYVERPYDYARTPQYRSLLVLETRLIRERVTP